MCICLLRFFFPFSSSSFSFPLSPCEAISKQKPVRELQDRSGGSLRRCLQTTVMSAAFVVAVVAVVVVAKEVAVICAEMMAHVGICALMC